VSIARALSSPAAVVMCMVVSACASRPPASVIPPGCYYFERDAAAERLQLPWGVQLLEDSISGWPALQELSGVRRAVTLLGHGRSASHPFGYWRLVGSDSVEIGYPAGGGLVLDLHAENGRLTGSALPVGDAVAPGEAATRTRGNVRLIHARCPDDG
jgi:hypothetical protein